MIRDGAEIYFVSFPDGFSRENRVCEQKALFFVISTVGKIFNTGIILTSQNLLKKSKFFLLFFFFIYRIYIEEIFGAVQELRIVMEILF